MAARQGRHTVAALGATTAAPVPRVSAGKPPAAAAPATSPPAAAAHGGASAYPQLAARIRSSMDESASACDDFYRYACGGWVKRARLKPSQSQVVRPFTKLATSNAALAHEILHKGDGGGALLSTYYRSCMDEAAIDAAGTAPLARLLGLIDEAANIFALTYVAGKLQRVGVHCFFGLSVAPDPADSRRNLIWIGQKGLGMPGRSFYLGKAKAARFRQPYVAHVAAMLGMLAGDGGRHEEAAVAIYDFEVQLAKAMLPRTATMDPRKYKGLSLAALQKLSPGIEWSAVCEGAGLPLGIKARAHARGRKHAAAAAGGEEQADDDAPEFLAVAPAYVAALSKLLGATPYSTLQSYARFRLARNFGALLPTHMRREHFAFYYQTLRGQKAPVARDRECSSMATLYLGDALGERFVRLIDAAGSKAAASDLLARLKAELGEDLKRGGAAGWMGGKARRAAQRKLGRLEMLVGYPAHFDKYAPLRSPSGGTKLAPGTYLANTMRIAALAFDDAAKSLTRPVDRTKWSVPPSLANAYYDRSRNAMVVPAGILQPPMFDAHAPAVLNFGSIGTVVGHEMTHGFDAMGRM